MALVSKWLLDLDDFGLENKKHNKPYVTMFENPRSSKDNKQMGVKKLNFKCPEYPLAI